MISSKKLIKMARKWQRMASLGNRRRRLSSLTTTTGTNGHAPFVADKGHFVIYTADKRRFMVPLNYLYTDLIQELFKISEDEFGLSSSGPIIVPCDAPSMEYIISLIQRGLAKDLERALLNTIASSRCSLADSSARTADASRQVNVCVH